MVNKIRNGVVWIRTPKCATTTTAIHLQSFCEWKKMKYLSVDEHGSVPPPNYMNLGHIWAGNVNWNTIKRTDMGSMASIRNPLDRFISHYKHHTIQEGRFGQYGDDISSFYLENFSNTHFENYFRGMDNYIAKYLDVITKEKLDIKLVKERYDFFVVAEDIDKSLMKFERLTGYTFNNKDIRENVTQNTNLIITDEFVKKFKENNQIDYQLYEYVIKEYGY